MNATKEDDESFKAHLESEYNKGLEAIIAYIRQVRQTEDFWTVMKMATLADKHHEEKYGSSMISVINPSPLNEGFSTPYAIRQAVYPQAPNPLTRVDGIKMVYKGPPDDDYLSESIVKSVKWACHNYYTAEFSYG